MPRPTEADLFAEEQSMPAMSFGDHIEELRARLILALFGLAVGVTIAFVPLPSPRGWLPIGNWVFNQMQEPAQVALDEFYTKESIRRQEQARANQTRTQPFEAEIRLASFAEAIKQVAPDAKVPPPASFGDRTVKLPLVYQQADWIAGVTMSAEKKRALISLTPLETFMIYFMVCMVAGLVIASPWVFYQFWAFIGAGLYRHERYYVMKFLPFSLGLFLGGVGLCFFFVLPITLKFLLEFNVWLNIEPTLRLTDWMSFATFLPLIFGVCFQTPLVMLVLERIGIFSAADYRSKRRLAILIIVVAAAAITPTGDPMTMMLLAGPMYALYELGIWLIPNRAGSDAPAAAA